MPRAKLSPATTADAAAIVELAQLYFRRMPGVTRVETVGSWRRAESAAAMGASRSQASRPRRLKDLDLLITARGGTAVPQWRDYDPAIWRSVSRAGVGRIEIRRRTLAGDRHSTAVFHLELPASTGVRGAAAGTSSAATPRRVQVKLDVFWASPAERPYALFHYTGPRSYNIRTRAYAQRKGLLLNQYGLWQRGGGGQPPLRRARGSTRVRTERDVAELLGVTWRPPHLRR